MAAGVRREEVSSPLEGIFVLDLSRVLAGPFCTMMLGDLGARVVKVEHPRDGDVTRGWGPPYHAESGLSAYYLSVNRNKESIALDLATPAGAESVRRLAARSDVLIENFPPGGFEKFGLSLEALRQTSPGLVTASITGYGKSGPDASAPGFDLLAQAGAGLMAITGTPEGGPTKVGVAVSDLIAGCYTAIGILAALTARERTGQGGHVETDLFSATLGSLINVAQSALLTGEEPVRHGNAHPQIVPYRAFEASDGAFALGVGTDRQFERLAALVGRPEWAGGGPYTTNDARVTGREGLEKELSEIFRGQTRETWVARCRAAGLPVGPVRSPLEALRSETARALGSVLVARGVEFVASPIRVAGAERRLRFPPALDADGERLRREFDLPE
jgi:crotonobetainyl-CoA:carnitine CoA-transferase CaiB-like acyl-CoA transferase